MLRITIVQFHFIWLLVIVISQIFSPSKPKLKSHLPAISAHPRIVELLIKCGSDVDARDKNNSTPLLLTVACGMFSNFLFLFRHFIFIYRCDLIVFLDNKYAQIIAKILIENGADINATYKDNWTTLHYVAKQGTFQLNSKSFQIN